MTQEEVDAAISRLREAVLADISEDGQPIEELGDWHSDLVHAFNDFAELVGADLITNEDIRSLEEYDEDEEE